MDSEIKCSTTLTLWQSPTGTLLSNIQFGGTMLIEATCKSNGNEIQIDVGATIKIFKTAALFSQRCFPQELEVHVLLSSTQCAIWENVNFQGLCKLNK